MTGFILFCLGLTLGSFLHVIASRYDPEHFLFARKTLGGRSHCTHCKKTLAWYELIPLISFLIQRGKCRSCGARLEWNYLWVELVSGFLVAWVPAEIAARAFSFTLGSAALAILSPQVMALAILWTLVFLILLLMTLIDIRLHIIPDELTVALVLIGLGTVALGHGTVLLGMGPDALLSIFWAALGAALFFGLLIVITRGRGMGMGDMKLAFALGILFGWPLIVPLIMLAFVIGALVGVVLILRGSKNMKSALPFGPFLALSAGIVFWLFPLILFFSHTLALI